MAFSGRSFTGLSKENLYSSAKACKILPYQVSREVVLDQGRIAPSAKVSRLFGITRSGSTSSLVPSPVQAEQAPWGELKEKFLGCNSAISTCPSGQENFCDKKISLLCPSFCNITTPSPKSTAVSKESATRVRSPGSMVIRSTPTSTVCFLFFSSLVAIASSILIIFPSNRTLE